MNKLVIIIFFSILSFVSFTQNCIPDSIIFSRQEQIDSFPLNYPNCNIVDGSIIITDKVINLDSLKQLKSIKGNLHIQFCDTLSNLKGLDSLASIKGELKILSNKSLKYLDGLEHINKVESNIIIANNDSLVTISNFPKIKSRNHDLVIIYNKSLRKISDFNNFISARSITIGFNNSLDTIKSFSNIKEISRFLDISNNPKLKTVLAFDSLKKVQTLRIYSNDSLITLPEFKNLISFTACLIENNSSLTNLNWLRNIKEMNHSVIKVANNKSLSDISGLENTKISNIGALILFYLNDTLINNNLQKITKNIEFKGIEFYNNKNLSECDIKSICNFIPDSGFGLFIHDNKRGCNSIEEVLTACNSPVDCTTLIDPIPGSTNINIDKKLFWKAVDNALGYKLSISTEVEDNYLIKNFDTGSDTSYTYLYLPCNSDIYVKIIPYNNEGNAMGCFEEKFSTGTFDSNITFTNESALNANNGTATCNPNHGKSPYYYLWSTGETLKSIKDLSPDKYFVTISDSNNCITIDSVEIKKFICPDLTIIVDTIDVYCNNLCDGALEIKEISNGTTPFTYLWSTGKNMKKIDSLCPGSYSVTVVDGNNCNVYGSYTITEPQPLSANATSTDETANDAKDGTAISNPSGGTQSYAYSWSTSDTTQAISGLAPESYFLTVTDANGCMALDTVTVKKFTCPNLIVNFHTSNISCFGSCDGFIAVLNVNNAVLPLSYKWNNGETSLFLGNLCAGDYSVTITDAKNCEVVQNYTLIQPDKITITVDSTRDIRLDSPGYIAITNNNGNCIFSWTGPGNFTAKTEDLDSLSDFGCYTLTVTDTSTNCSIDSTICLEDKTAIYNLELGNINIYPNPAKNDFIIDFSNTKLSNAEIILFDLSGKIQLQLEKKSKDKILKVDSETLNADLYIIRIRSTELGITYRKIVLSK